MPKGEVALRSRGRITIPVEVRRRLGLREGHHLTAEVQDGSIVLRLKDRMRVREFRGLLGRHRVRLEDIESALGTQVEAELKRIHRR